MRYLDLTTPLGRAQSRKTGRFQRYIKYRPVFLSRFLFSVTPLILELCWAKIPSAPTLPDSQSSAQARTRPQGGSILLRSQRLRRSPSATRDGIRYMGRACIL